ncbi:cellular response to bisphenol A [Trichomonas vaginalis G3]|nr:cellular response to bisphenol A [Trichomonas vaginalis G3]KAI5528493.1 cellular response to bisphenol A [Trichomonas vaginalis G3]
MNSGFLGPSYILKKEDNNKLYICKAFSKKAIGDEADVDNFIQTIRIVRGLKEACFLPYHYYYNEEGFVYAIRPFFEGLDLYSYITNCDLDINSIYAQWKVLVRIYRHLHKRKIAPNTIKASNIFVENGTVAFITDIYPPPKSFNPTIHKSNPFDVGFLSPEYLTLGCPPSYKSDIWSLGVLLWFMVTKKLPWNVNNIVVMLKQIQRATPENSNSLPDEIKEIMATMLQFNPDSRAETEVLVHTMPGKQIAKLPPIGPEIRSNSLKIAGDIVVKKLKGSPSSPITLNGIKPSPHRISLDDSDSGDKKIHAAGGNQNIQLNIPTKFTRRVGIISRQGSLTTIQRFAPK